jgi:hypothetical protein
VCLKIAPSIFCVDNDSDEAPGSNLSCLCSLFNLLQICTKNNNSGSLDEIDALLGCGIIMFEKVESAVRLVYMTYQIHCPHIAY